MLSALTGSLEKKACQLSANLRLKSPVPLVQSSFANAHLMKAKFWGKYLLKSRWLFVHAIMRADCPATGGYPKIGAVVSADLPLVAQCVPNKSRIRFRETTVAKAQKKFRAMMNGLNNNIVDEE